METLHISASATVNAPAEHVYSIIADYREGHPRILPPRYFRNLVVEEGGVGAGTVIRCDLRAFGVTRTFRSTVDEPRPGVLVETIPADGTVTTFTVAPAEGGASRVTITTEAKVRPGLLGRIERAMTTKLLGRAYADELALLGAVAAR